MNDSERGSEGQSPCMFLAGRATSQIRNPADTRCTVGTALPPMPPRTLTKWSLSPSYDALERNLEASAFAL